ncbi:hypothetical protein QX776_02060 [Alteromonadaceae bacterium BrNp21-10]|nr:hypothetical protein [Alteromonadaceae bacterium BrNp21-10]
MMHNINIKSGLAVCFVVVSSFMTSGCIQGQSFAATFNGDAPSASVPDNTLKIVKGAFYTSLSRGDWYFKGAHATNGNINAYIQVPEKLNMDKSNIKNYVKHVICPNVGDDFMWQKLEHITLNVHIYTKGDRRGVKEQCSNPLV